MNSENEEAGAGSGRRREGWSGLVGAILALAALPAPKAAATGGVGRAAAAHYVVFSLDEAGVPRVESHQLVQLPAELATRSRAEVARKVVETPRGSDAVVVRLVSEDGTMLFQDALHVPGGLHLEEGLHGETVLDARDVRPVQRSFVVRVPVAARTTLRLSSASAEGESAPAVFDVEALAGDARLPLARFAPSASVSGSVDRSGNRLNVLVMGDGYTASEQAKFEADAASLVDRFFSISPYAEYRNVVSLSTLFTPSVQSGASHPPYQASCASKSVATCCADPAARSDARQGTFVTTNFNATFCSQNVHRLLVVDSAKVLTAAAAVPGWDRILVLVNDPTYGGSGGALSVVALHPSAVGIAQHEFGHSFTRLADEYDAAYPGYPSCSDVAGFFPCEANVTDQTAAADIKWGSWISASTPVPTGEFDPAGVGLYPGARYRASGLYRPEHDCLMRTLGAPFCKVCAQEYVRTLYKGGWGNPAQGIDIIEPGTEFPAPGSHSLALGESLPFRIELIQPAGNTVSATWMVNGTEAGHGSTFTFTPSAPGTYTVSVAAHDASPFVSAAMAGDLLDSSRTWTVTLSAPTQCATGIDSLCAALVAPRAR